jgi:acid phosphatase family membrane protein YuiD
MMETSRYALLAAPFAGWIAAQLLKFIFTLRKDGVSLHDAIQSGGMPSSHSAFMTSLSIAIGLTEGIDSAIFAVSLALTAIIMYDATGVRRTTGEQTVALIAIAKKLVQKYNCIMMPVDTRR